MPVGKVKGREAGPVQGIKQRMKSRGGGKFFDRVPADSEITFRFLTEPDRWFEFYEHYLEEHKYFPCNSGDCIGCDESHRPGLKYVAYVFDVNEKKTKNLLMSSKTAEDVIKKFNRNKTLLDRDYIISREGSGMNDTSYEVDACPPTKRKDLIAKLQKDMPDLAAIAQAQIPGAEDEEEEFDNFLPEDKKRPAKKLVKKKAGAVKKRTRPARDEDEDDDPPWETKKRTKPAMKKTGRTLSRR